jgi:hypothetical protein
MNTTAYIIYLFITYVITVRVGLLFYRNGRIFILSLLHNDEKLTDFINRILLIGYYLLNLGYVALMLAGWQTITSWLDMFTIIVSMTARIMLTLAIMHFSNMAVIYFISKNNSHFTHTKI